MDTFTKSFGSKAGVIGAALFALVAMFVSVSTSANPARSWVVWLFTLTCFAIAGELMWRSLDAGRILDWLFTASLALLAFHLWMTIGRDDGRVWSPTALGNLAAALLMPALAIRRLRWSLYALAIVLLSGSRGAWLNVAAGLFTLAALEHSFIAFVKTLWPVGIAALPILAFQVMRPYERVSMWATAIAMFRTAPVLGVGPGTFGLFHPLYPDAHNLILNLAAENGLIGLVSFGLLAIAVGRALWIRRASPFVRGVIASCIGMLAAGLIGVPTYEIAVSAALAVLIGVALND